MVENVINVKSGDTIIVIACRSGTLSEVGLALSVGKKVIAARGTDGLLISWLERF